MTEAEWLSADLATRYSYLLPHSNGDKLSLLPRRGRLLWVAWAREVYLQLPWVYRLEVDYAERLADDPALTVTDLRSILCGGTEGIEYADPGPARILSMRKLEEQLRDEFGLLPRGDEPPYAPTAEMLTAIQQAYFALKHVTPRSSMLPNSEVFEDYFRDIFGNPFRPPVFDADWRSETATALATGIYEGRAFDRMPILADALEDAGCDNAEILAHCRGDGAHVRGCWTVDLVLGKQ